MRTLKLLLLALLASGPQLLAAPPAKPNVLFIAIDDLRDWVGYLGHNAQTITPNLDKFSKKGEYFTHSYCAAPVCNPSRTALMSGMRPGVTGIYSNDDDWRPAVTPDKTLNVTFHNAGYFVCGAGKIYHESYKRNEDWDNYLENEGGIKERKSRNAAEAAEAKEKKKTIPLKERKAGKTAAVAAAAAPDPDGVGGIKFKPLDCEDKDLPDYNIVSYGIDELSKKHDRPFFLAVGVHKPHMPWDVPRKYYDMHPLDKIELPPHIEHDLDDVPKSGQKMAKPDGDHANILASGRWKDAVQGYLAAISFCDAQLGRLLEAYEKAPDKDNTLIVLWSDHGWHLGEKEHWRKFALWEEATRSPVIWYVPGLTKPGSVCERTIDHLHIFPTLTDLCGIPTPKHVEGKSIKSLLADAKAPWGEPAITTYLFKNHAIRTEDSRLIRYADGDEEFYDEKKDPNEWTNLATSQESVAKRAELAKWLPTINNPEKFDRNKKKKESDEN